MLPNIGLGELTVIVLVALLIFGPNKLPEMMRSAGRALGRFQRESQSALAELRNATDVKADLGAPPTLGAFDAADPTAAATTAAAAAATATPAAAVAPATSPAAAAPTSPKPRASRANPRKPAAKTAKPATKRTRTAAKRPASPAEPFEDT